MPTAYTFDVFNEHDALVFSVDAPSSIAAVARAQQKSASLNLGSQSLTVRLALSAAPKGPRSKIAGRLPKKIQVIRHDIAPNGLATSRMPVDFDDEESARKYVEVVRDAIDRWGDNSLVELRIDGKAVKVSREGRQA